MVGEGARWGALPKPERGTVMSTTNVAVGPAIAGRPADIHVTGRRIVATIIDGLVLRAPVRPDGRRPRDDHRVFRTLDHENADFRNGSGEPWIMTNVLASGGRRLGAGDVTRVGRPRR